MKAGFARVDITPAPGMGMAGYPQRDSAGPCREVHDPLYVRALWLESDGRRLAIVSHDLLFFDRLEVSRIKEGIGAASGLQPHEILLNASHTHSGPNTSTWLLGRYTNPPDAGYLQRVREATSAAVRQACDRRQEVSMQVGRGSTDLPVSRRKRDAQGRAQWAPEPAAEVCTDLPVCSFRDAQGTVVALLFSVACHPSTTNGHVISADYPGVACRRLDEALGGGIPAAMFLAGCAGDTKARVIADGDGGRYWRNGSWADIEAAGNAVAERVLETLARPCVNVAPDVHCWMTELAFALEQPPTRAVLEEQAACQDHPARHLWAADLLRRLDRGEPLPSHAPVTLQVIRLGAGLRIVALEGEPVGVLGKRIRAMAGDGVTFVLGYSNGQGLYLPSDAMLPEGGYEVDSAWEYGFPASLKLGIEETLRAGLARAKAEGAT